MSKFVIARKSPIFQNRAQNKAQRNNTHVGPSIDDEWEKMYLEDGDKVSCQNTTSPRIIDDEWEKKHLSGSEEVYIPHPQIDDDWEAMYLDNEEESKKATNDKDIFRKLFDQNEAEQYDYSDDSSSNYSSLSVLDLQNVEQINDNSKNEAYLEDVEDDDDVTFQKFVNPGAHQDLPPNITSPQIIDDEYDEWEKKHLNGSEEMYMPHPQIADDWEAMYLDNEEERKNVTNDKDQNEAEQYDYSDDDDLDDLTFEQFENSGVHEDSPPLESKTELSGRRIVDMGFVFKQIQTAGKHTENCHFENMTLQHEIRKGLSSSFIFRCDVCGTMTRIETDQKKKSALGINRDAVLGITTVGLGFSHIEELCANFNVPPMSYKLFRKEEKIQQEDWFKTAKLAALKALMTEIELAKANNEVDSKGNALIRVITDGSWGKRSYGKYFSSLSGCAVIIGLRTNKVIYFDVRNKYCHICKLAEVKGVTVRHHKCNKNYDGPSSGMESDIILNGFKECDQLGARFNVLISDGDSNTYKLIRDLRIYKEPDVFVAKLECVNHLYRNFYKKFNNLSSITKFDSGSRKTYITKAFCLDLCKGIRMASQHWRESNETLPMKKRLLERDILNAPAHYFGYHEDCNSYFCKKTTVPGAVDTINFLKDDGLFYEIQSICQTYFGNNAKSLLANYTNNPAEQLNSYVAKYLGGKRINYSLAGSYTARVAMAVVHFNSKCQAISEYRKMKFGGVSDMPSVAMVENKRKRKVLQNAVARAKKPRVRRTNGDQGQAYGGDYADDMEPTALEAAKNIIMEKLIRNKNIRNSIEAATKEDESYYSEKIRNMLMSYYFSNIISSKGPKFYMNILDEIMYTHKQLGNNAQNIHQRIQELEALATIQRHYPKSSIKECGLFIDEELPYLGASPFRLFDSDYILSIKCPLSEYKKNIDDAKIPLWKIVSGKRTLNKKSAWYLEIQGELHITKKKATYLMIWLGKNENQYQFVKLKREDDFFETEMKEKLGFFYKEVMLPELANSRRGRRMELRQYDEVTKTFM